MLLYFVRHGQTDDNVAGIIQGQKDTPLNDHGRHEAALVSARLEKDPGGFQEIWSSSLSRASETAEIIARPHDLPVQTHPGLMERGLGSLEGRWRKHGEPLPHDVETGEQFRKRIIDWFDNFLSDHRKSIGPICVISHGAYITTFVSLLLSEQHFGFKRGKKVNLREGCYNTMIMRIECEYNEKMDKWNGEVQSWGDIQHLKGIRSEGRAGGVADDVKA